LPHPYAFEAGTQYVLQGVGFHILKVLSNDQILVRNLLTMYEEAHNQKDLQVKWDAGLLEFGRQGRNLREVKDCPVKTSYEFTDLDFLKNEKHGAELLQETWDKYDLIRRLFDLPRTERTDMRIEAEIKRYVAEQILLMMSGNRIALPFPQHSGKRNKEVPQVDGGKVLLFRMLEQLESGELSSEQLLASASLQLISARQVRRWMGEFERSHRDIRSLVPAFYRRGLKGVQLDPIVEKLLKEAVDTVYLAEEQLSVKKVIEKLEFLINQANSTSLADETELVLPGKRKVYRYIDGLDPMEVDTARLGRRAARRKHAQHKRGPRPTRPNERWEEDDTLTDLFVIDEEDGLPIGRPWLTAVREKKCGVVPGFALSFDPPSTQTVMECLFYAIPEKRHVKELFGLRNDYVGYGVPETLAVDRGSGYLNRDMEFACAQLGIELDPMPGRSPWLKGGIERFQGMAEVDLFHAQPGTTFSDFWKRGDYDPTKHACITLDGLWYLIHKWIVDIYTREPHKGIGGLSGGVPAKLWERALGRDFVPRLPASRNELAVLLSRVESRIIQSNGIEFENLWYQDNRLSKLRDTLNKSTPHVPVMFKYNPGDLSRIWVMYPGLNRYLEVLAVEQQYTQGLSLWKHRMIKRYAREELKKDIDRVSLIQAKEELRQLVYDEFRWGKKLSGRKRNARFLDIRVNEILRSAKRVDSTEASSFSLFIDVDLPAVELKSPESQEIHPEQAVVEPSSTLECIAQFDGSLPPQVEGVTLPVNDEVKTAGARLSQPQQLSQQQAKERVDATQPPEIPKVNTDPDEATSFGIVFGYGRRGPT
jgi:putative transposase